MSHIEFISSLTRSVRTNGSVAALDELRATRPGFASGGVYHETAAVFFVWAVDRLVHAGLSDVGVLWHPLTAASSPRSWWDRHTMVSSAAREGFVASTLAHADEPQPSLPTRNLVAA